MALISYEPKIMMRKDKNKVVNKFEIFLNFSFLFLMRWLSQLPDAITVHITTLNIQLLLGFILHLLVS